MSLHPFRGVQSPTISYFEEGHYEFNFQLMPCCLLQTSSLFQHKLYMQENWHLLLNISAWSYRINIISRELRRRRDTPKKEYLKNEAGTTRCELPKKFLPKGQIIFFFSGRQTFYHVLYTFCSCDDFFPAPKISTHFSFTFSIFLHLFPKLHIFC